METFPALGDVISSPKFAYGYYEYGNKGGVITVDGKTMHRLTDIVMHEEERVALAAQTGSIPPKKNLVDFGAYDASRANAQFRVEKAQMQGGGVGNGGRDHYPDGWYIRARRLNNDGSYNPNGEQICFYASGCFTCLVAPKDIQLIRRADE